MTNNLLEQIFIFIILTFANPLFSHHPLRKNIYSLTIYSHNGFSYNSKSYSHIRYPTLLTYLTFSDNLDEQFSAPFEADDNSIDMFLDHETDNKKSQTNNLKTVTKTIRKGGKFKRGYISISNELRLELIEAVHQHGDNVKTVLYNPCS